MVVEDLVRSRVGPSVELSPLDCQKLLQLQHHYGEDRFAYAVQTLKPNERNPVEQLQRCLTANESMKSTFVKRCHVHDLSWNVLESGTSLCPKCYP